VPGADARTRALAGAGTLVLRGLAATWRYEITNRSAVRTLRAAGTPILFAFWHAQMLPLLALHRREGAAILISEHRDGEIVARIARCLGYNPVRGSTTRSAAGALRAMDRVLRAGRDIGVTPDGPRGPARQFAPGTLMAAQRAKAPIVLVGVAVDHSWYVESWDRFSIPKPLARIGVAYSEPYYVESPTARGAAAAAGLFGERLDAMDAAAQRAIARRIEPVAPVPRAD
jgi:lysophospholipid acyltransferase (LPLAT)-like uncharacterized protein